MISEGFEKGIKTVGRELYREFDVGGDCGLFERDLGGVALCSTYQAASGAGAKICVNC